MSAPPINDTVADAIAGNLRRGQLLLILIIATAVGVLAMNIILPSLPSIARDFDTSRHAAQLVLTAFLFALATGQLVYGVASDRFGRRPTMIVGLTIFAIGTLICTVAWSFEALIAGRFIQGAGASTAMVIGRAILRDLFDRNEAASLLAYVTMAMVVAPMLAPAIGGALQETVGWRASMLLLLTAAGFVIVLIILRLPETNPNLGMSASLPQHLKSYRILLASPLFMSYAAIGAFTSATFFTFVGGVPYITIELMGRGPGEFGLWIILVAAAYMAGNFITARFAQRIGTRAMMRYGTAICVVGAAVLVLFALYGPFVPLALFAPMMIVTFSNGLVMASAITSGVSVRPDLAGAAAGLSGFLQFTAGGLVTVLVSLVHDGTAVPLALMILAAAILSLFAYFEATRYPDPVT